MEGPHRWCDTLATVRPLSTTTSRLGVPDKLLPGQSITEMLQRVMLRGLTFVQELGR